MVRIYAVGMWILVWVLGGLNQASGQQIVIAEGGWSKPVADSRGFAVRGRLVLCEKQRSDDRRELGVYVELQDARDSVGGSMRVFCDFGRTDFRPEYKGGLRCQLLDKAGKPVSAESYPFGGAIPMSEWVTLPTDATIRLRASPFGIHRAKALAISPQLGQLWVLRNDDPNEYYLSGTFTVDPDAGKQTVEDPHIWRGVLELPAVRVTSQQR